MTTSVYYICNWCEEEIHSEWFIEKEDDIHYHTECYAILAKTIESDNTL